MFNVAPNVRASGILTIKRLANLKRRAMRSGAWFKALQRIDRVLLDLTIRVVGYVKSAKLAKSIIALTVKLEEAMGRKSSIRLRKIGLPLDKKISLTAQKLGNISAKDWACDPLFAEFLGVMCTNVRSI